MENQTEMKKTFLGNKETPNGIYRLMSVVEETGKPIKYYIEKQTSSLHWKTIEIYTRYLNATKKFLSIQ